MKIINNILYIESIDFINSGWKEAALWNANLRNGPYWMIIKNPDDKRKPLVQYDTLRPQHSSTKMKRATPLKLNSSKTLTTKSSI